jgi:hypothetical protein
LDWKSSAIYNETERDARVPLADETRLRGKYVFLNPDDKPIEIETLRKNAWSKELIKAGLDYRPVIQTLHTFAMMISAGRMSSINILYQFLVI